MNLRCQFDYPSHNCDKILLGNIQLVASGTNTTHFRRTAKLYIALKNKCLVPKDSNPCCTHPRRLNGLSWFFQGCKSGKVIGAWYKYCDFPTLFPVIRHHKNNIRYTRTHDEAVTGRTLSYVKRRSTERWGGAQNGERFLRVRSYSTTAHFGSVPKKGHTLTLDSFAKPWWFILQAKLTKQGFAGQALKFTAEFSVDN